MFLLPSAHLGRIVLATQDVRAPLGLEAFVITITPDGVWVKCKDCNAWAQLTAQDTVVLYSFFEVPLMNWVFYECSVCEEDKHLFLLSYKDPEYLLAVLQDASKVAEVALELPSDTDLSLFAATYGHIPQLHVRHYIETVVGEFAKELNNLASPLEMLE